jgi:hypothetical protein
VQVLHEVVVFFAWPHDYRGIPSVLNNAEICTWGLLRRWRN